MEWLHALTSKCIQEERTAKRQKSQGARYLELKVRLGVLTPTCVVLAVFVGFCGSLSTDISREYRDLRREVRCLERRFRRTRSDQDRAAWTRRLRHMYAVLREKEMRYWENLIEQDAGKPRRLWASF